MNKKIILFTSIIAIILISFVVSIGLLIKKENFKEDNTTTKTTTKEVTTTEEVTTTRSDVISENAKITMYIFYGDGCPHCAALHEYIDELILEDEYKGKMNVVNYEVWNNSKNAKLLNDVKEYFATDVNGVPFYLIGDKVFFGFSEAKKDEIKATINEELKNSKYKDVISIIEKK